MKTHIAKLCVAGAFAVPAPAFSQQVSINFDDLGPLAVIGSTYSALGVTFINAITVEYRDGKPVFCAFEGSTCPNTIKSTDSFANGAQPQPDTPIVAVFSTPVSYASVTGISLNLNGMLLRGYDATQGGNLVSSAQTIGPESLYDNSYYANLSVAGSGIRRIEFSQLQYVQSGDDIIFDNLVFTPQSPVPESATSALYLVGLGLLAGALRSSFKAVS